MKVKKSIQIVLFALLIVLSGCAGRNTNYVDDQTRLENNNMDFPDLELQYFKGINFKLSEMFTRDYDEDYVLSDESKTMAIWDLSLNFSVELFDDSDADRIQYAFNDDIDKLNAVHDNYIIKRQESLYDSEVSIKKEVPKSVGFPGYMQVVHGSTYEYDDDQSSYFTATVQIGDDYFVFQLIGKRDNMGYLHDDFIDILSSIEK